METLIIVSLPWILGLVLFCGLKLLENVSARRYRKRLQRRLESVRPLSYPNIPKSYQRRVR